MVAIPAPQALFSPSTEQQDFEFVEQQSMWRDEIDQLAPDANPHDVADLLRHRLTLWNVDDWRDLRALIEEPVCELTGRDEHTSAWWDNGDDRDTHKLERENEHLRERVAGLEALEACDTPGDAFEMLRAELGNFSRSDWREAGGADRRRGALTWASAPASSATSTTSTPRRSPRPPSRRGAIWRRASPSSNPVPAPATSSTICGCWAAPVSTPSIWCQSARTSVATRG